MIVLQVVGTFFLLVATWSASKFWTKKTRKGLRDIAFYVMIYWLVALFPTYIDAAFGGQFIEIEWLEIVGLSAAFMFSYPLHIFLALVAGLVVRLLVLCFGAVYRKISDTIKSLPED